jgi:hypothetical protein
LSDGRWERIIEAVEDEAPAQPDVNTIAEMSILDAERGQLEMSSSPVRSY